MLGWLGLLAGAFGGYEVASVEVTRPHASLERVVYEIDVGDDPLNRFSIVNVSKRGGHGPRQPIILLSPFTLPAEFYEISETGQYHKSAAGELAQSNYDVWLVDHRQTNLPPGACESGVADCSVMATWDFDTLSTDALFALALLRAESPGAPKPVLGGFSAGANVALATVNRAPHAFSGLFLYEGTFYTEDSAIIAHNDAICTNLEVSIAGGGAYDPSFAVIRLALTGASQAPSDPFPLPVFPPGTTNQQAMLYVFGAPPPQGALAPTPGFVRNVANFQTEKLVYSNQKRLELVGPLFDNYGSLAAIRDLACGLAGQDTRHFENVSDFEGDVLVFVEGTGFGPAMFDTASLFTSADSVTIDHNPELGEADVYFNTDWKRTFQKPLERWLSREVDWQPANASRRHACSRR